MPAKKWEMPCLQILARGRSEEAILDLCKTGEGTGISPAGYHVACYYEGPGSACQLCQNINPFESLAPGCRLCGRLDGGFTTRDGRVCAVRPL